jgi:hypothetical protein
MRFLKSLFLRRYGIKYPQSIHCKYVCNVVFDSIGFIHHFSLIIGMDVAGDVNRVEQGAGYLRINAVVIDRVDDLAYRGILSERRIERAANGATLEASAVSVMVVAVRRITQCDAVALRAVGENVDASADRS